MAVMAWNWMDGNMQWEALPIVCDVLGIDDPEQLINDLMTIRKHMRHKQNG